MRFGVLGPVAVWDGGGRVVRVADRKVREVLAQLLVEAGVPVPASRLIDDLWPQRLPANPANALQTRISQLRRALEDAEPGGRELVVSQPPGYLLRVAPDKVDSGRFRALVATARATADPVGRAGILAEALGLWRGAAFADFGEEAFARAAAGRLEEERLAAHEELAETRLELGEHAALVAELADLVARNPLRQRLRGLYMRALYASAKHIEALETYAELRDRLVREAGLDPAPELSALHQAILRQDVPPALNPPHALAGLIGRDVPPALNPPHALAGLTGRDVPPALNPPHALAGLIGRDGAVREVAARLAEARLVTLTGTGGVGKTRLALEVAHRHAGAVAWVELAAAGDDEVERLVRGLSGRESLLVLDNCEHVIGAAAGVAERLLRASAGLRVLATSREPLAIPGEVLWEVPPLELANAIELFTARAGIPLGGNDSGTVAGICRRLDGIPLALELAATRVRGLGVHGVAERLDDRFRLLAPRTHGGPARQRTLRAVIDWSWRLLSDDERAVLCRVALHADTFTRQAAEAVCAEDVADVLGRLVDRSLLARVDAPGGMRYRLLESVGAYCRERLHESGEYEAVLKRHTAYYTGLSTRDEPRLYGHAPLFAYLGGEYSSTNIRRRIFGAENGADGAVRSADGTVRSADGTIRSVDGTMIAYDRYGRGPRIVLIGGALNDRQTFAPLAMRLAGDFTVYSYDRRGRGGSGDTLPYRVTREIEDLAALVKHAGGPVHAFAVSSGAVLAVDAAAHGVPIASLALIEPPFILDGTRSPVPADFAVRLGELVAAGRRGDAVELFLTEAVEMPAEVVAPMRTAPAWAALEALAHTLVYDLAVMGDFQLPDVWRTVPVPTMIFDGDQSATWRKHAARAAAATLPDAVHRTLDGHPHDAPPEILAPLLREFFTQKRVSSSRSIPRKRS